jgi:GH35 family endo-1,4-beta-xylanase
MFATKNTVWWRMIGVLVLVTALMLAACGGGGESSDTIEGDAEEPSTATMPAATEPITTTDPMTPTIPSAIEPIVPLTQPATQPEVEIPTPVELQPVSTEIPDGDTGAVPADPTAIAAIPAVPVGQGEQTGQAGQTGGSEIPLHTQHLNFGVVVHLYYTDHDRVLQLTKNAGFDWIRQQIVWKDTEGPNPGEYVWDHLDTIVNSTNEHGLKLLISVVQSPDFYNPTNGLPEDPAALGNFVQAMAERYGDKIQAYEIWNEQNLAHETGGRIVPEDAGHYVEILMESYKRIKAVNPNAFVLAGAPSSTGHTEPSVALSDLEYYKAMYTYKDGIIHDYFDIQAVHPGGSANPPETLWPDNPSTAEGWTDHSTFYFRHIENVRKVMEEHGMADHDMWITEYGWATENETPGYEFGNQITFEEQADFITRAVEYSYENYPWLGNMFLWNLNFAVTWQQANPPQPLHEQASFGILNGDWSPRPSYTALQGLIARLKAEQGRAN